MLEEEFQGIQEQLKSGSVWSKVLHSKILWARQIPKQMSEPQRHPACTITKYHRMYAVEWSYTKNVISTKEETENKSSQRVS